MEEVEVLEKTWPEQPNARQIAYDNWAEGRPADSQGGAASGGTGTPKRKRKSEEAQEAERKMKREAEASGKKAQELLRLSHESAGRRKLAQEAAETASGEEVIEVKKK